MRWIICLTILVAIVAPNNRSGKNMLFLIDKSGSMTTNKVNKALNQFINVAGQPVDAGTICIYKFGKYPIKWAHGWKELPSKTALDNASEFLKIVPADKTFTHNTRVGPALVAALREPKKQMSIIIISDGEFEESDYEIKTIILKWQKWRVKHGYGKATIGCVGVSFYKNESLTQIAKLDTGIGYYHVEEVKKKE